MSWMVEDVKADMLRIQGSDAGSEVLSQHRRDMCALLR